MKISSKLGNLLILIGFWIIVSITVILLLLYGPKFTPVKLVESPKPDTALSDTLTEWVYRNSSRISADSAKQITTKALSTDKPLLILSIICVESEFTPSATSNKGAKGLMQVSFKPHKKMLTDRGIITDERDLFNIDANIEAGNAILDMYIALCRGDVGGALDKYLGAQSAAYSKKVLGNLADLYVLVNKRKEGNNATKSSR